MPRLPAVEGRSSEASPRNDGVAMLALILIPHCLRCDLYLGEYRTSGSQGSLTYQISEKMDSPPRRAAPHQGTVAQRRPARRCTNVPNRVAQIPLVQLFVDFVFFDFIEEGRVVYL